MTQPVPAGAQTSNRPAVYMPGGQPLPYYARPDLAYLDGVYLRDSGAGLVWGIQPPSGFLERIVFGNYTLQTGPTVANRYPLLQFVDQYGGTIWQSVSQTAIPANTTATITFSTSITSAWDNGSNFMLPIPDTLLWAGATVFVQSTNYQADDHITRVQYYRELIPTGPPLEDETNAAAPLIPTPLVL